MTTAQPVPAGTVAAPRRPRLAGVDAARCVALVGMMAVHVLPLVGAAAITAHDVAGGRSAALFALLAGVGLALASGADRPPHGADLARARRGIVARSVVVAVIGFTLGGFPTSAAIILAYYGVLFLAAVPVLGWGPRRLAVAAAVCALGTPVLSHLLRGHVPAGPGPNLSWESLADPVNVLVTLLLTGYYPVLTWTTYLFAGLAVGRLPLDRARVAALVAVTGVVAAVAAWIGHLVAAGLAHRRPAEELPVNFDHGEQLGSVFFGTTPADSWWWLVGMEPHSGTPFDLVHTTGTSLAVLGVMLLVAPRLGRWILPLTAAGSMTLTLYSLHVIALGLVQEHAGWPPPPAWPTLAVHVVVALVLATAWRATGRRGPLEELSAAAVTAVGGGRAATRDRA